MGKQSKSSPSKENSPKNDDVDDVDDIVVGGGDDDDDNDSVVPIEMSDDEYQDLVSQVKDLTLEEAQEEWMESCRYGDVDVVRALAENFTLSPLIEYAHPDSGNTGLHLASANGHTILLSFSFEYIDTVLPVTHQAIHHYIGRPLTVKYLSSNFGRVKQSLKSTF